MHVFFPKLIRVGFACIAFWALPQAGAAQGASRSSLEALGARIFSDRTLSADGSVSCASCHRPDHAFADDIPARPGAGGLVGHRNAPSLLNVVAQHVFFWDGRADDLTDAVTAPFFQHAEMGLKNTADLARKVTNSTTRAIYADAYGADTPINRAYIGRALVAYLRQMSAAQRSARFPDVDMAAAARGATVFHQKAGCDTCHGGLAFTDDRFHPAGIGMDDISRDLPALMTKASSVPRQATDIGNAIGADIGLSRLGRYMVSRRASELGMFRTPSLLHVVDTAPYMHDGSIATLDDAVSREIYWRSLATGHPLALTGDERRDLVAFLRSLSGAYQPARVLTQSKVPPAASTAARAAVTSVAASATKRTVMPLKASLGSSL